MNIPSEHREALLSLILDCKIRNCGMLTKQADNGDELYAYVEGKCIYWGVNSGKDGCCKQRGQVPL